MKIQLVHPSDGTNNAIRIYKRRKKLSEFAVNMWFGDIAWKISSSKSELPDADISEYDEKFLRGAVVAMFSNSFLEKLKYFNDYEN